MDAQKTARQIFAFALAMIALLGFFAWLLGPWGPKTIEPSNTYCDGCNGQQNAPAVLADHPQTPAPVKIEIHSNKDYDCLRVYRGDKELHWQCFKVPAP